MSKALPFQYSDLKDCFQMLIPLVFPTVELRPDQHPIALLEGLEKTSMSQAKAVLKMSLGDIVEATLDWQADKVSDLDAALRARGLPTLTDLRKEFSRRYARVIKRGEIRNLEEYYLVKGVLDSTAPDDEEATSLIRLLTSFEDRVVPGNKSV